MSDPGAIAIILARAGSKGVPGKNHALVGGKPCIAYTIEQAQRSSRVGRVIVSTDDTPCAEIARAMGCTVIERPDDLAHDTATIDSAARHAYEAIGSQAAPVVILYANVPIRPESLIDDALAMLEDTGCDSVQSFAKVGKHHPWWTCRIDERGSLRAFEDGAPLFHNCFRRQDLPDALIPDGGVMAVTPDALMCRLGAPEGPHAFLGNDRRAIVTNEGDVIDIDSPIDLIVADTLMRSRSTTEHTEHTETRPERDWDGRDAELTHEIIGCAMRVHRELGPGLLESVYELCLFDELRRAGLEAKNQVVCDVTYHGRTIGSAMRMDLVVEDRVVIEIKAVDGLKRVHFAQLMSYLKLSSMRLGLLMNFNEGTLKSGIKRIAL